VESSPTSTLPWFERTPAPFTPAPPGLVYELPNPTGNSETDWLVDSTGQSIPWEAHLAIEDTSNYHSCCSCGCDEIEDTQKECFENPNDICYTNPQTGEERNITNTPDQEEWLSGLTLSNPDQLLLYSRTITEAQTWAQDLGAGSLPQRLATVRTDGSQYTTISHLFVGEPARSADGRYLAYDDGSCGSGCLYDVDTGVRPFPVEEFGLPPGLTGMYAPGWSPVENTITWWMDFYTTTGSTSGLGVFNLETKTARIFRDLYPEIVPDGQIPAPMWSPDGQWLSFYGRKASSDINYIWILNPDGDEYFTVGEIENYVHFCDRAWSPDSQWLAFSCSYPEKSGIWLVQNGTWKLYKVNLPDNAAVWEWIEPGP